MVKKKSMLDGAVKKQFKIPIHTPQHKSLYLHAQRPAYLAL